MWTRLELVNFKSFADQTIALSPMTVLVGANAAGKSNLLDAIRFFHGVGLNLSFSDIFRGRREGGRELWPGLRGGAREIARGSNSAFSLEVDITLPRLSPRSGVTEWKYKHRLEIDVSEVPRLQSETLKLDEGERQDKMIARLDPASKTATATYETWITRNGTRPSDGPHQLTGLSADSSTLPMFHERNPYPDEFVPFYLQALRAVFFLDISPRRMRDYVPQRTADIGLEGEHTSARMWQLCQDKSRKQDLVDWLAEVCAPELQDIDFITTALDDVMLVLVERDGTRTSARSLSDGTLRFLGVLVALLAVPTGSIVLMEELEAGLHPQRVHLLVEFLEEIARTRGVQIIATTHSPLVLQSLSEDVLKNAIVLARTSDDAGTVMRRLQDLPDFDALVERRGIEHLFATGWLERSL